MDHSYQIVTQEVNETSSGEPHFVAHLTKVYITVDGERIQAPYPNARFKGATYASAMLKANDAFRAWLENFERRQRVVERELHGVV